MNNINNVRAGHILSTKCLITTEWSDTALNPDEGFECSKNQYLIDLSPPKGSYQQVGLGNGMKIT